MLPYCLFHEILHKSPMELNMTSMVHPENFKTKFRKVPEFLNTKEFPEDEDIAS
ncbi:hypothetical protein T4B_1594 [Trichinella pseudospiralis]|uniref:Uncharacterized protein n=1 Tax=Trichinella pseudospiralis TaxID=6337 RepID=A0A0V1GJ03_TRIPS|nr:hypothetical protein T4B_1594 [Trichinella pseudospiralis]